MVKLYSKSSAKWVLDLKGTQSFLPWFSLLQNAASAFSERYLGAKTDSRVYTVKYPPFFLLCFRMLSSDNELGGLYKRTCQWHGGFPSVSFLQMANLAHRAGQLLEKQYLIIHPTADGRTQCFLFSKYHSKYVRAQSLTAISSSPPQKKFTSSTQPNSSTI